MRPQKNKYTKTLATTLTLIMLIGWASASISNPSSTNLEIGLIGQSNQIGIDGLNTDEGSTTANQTDDIILDFTTAENDNVDFGNVYTSSIDVSLSNSDFTSKVEQKYSDSFLITVNDTGTTGNDNTDVNITINNLDTTSITSETSTSYVVEEQDTSDKDPAGTTSDSTTHTFDLEDTQKPSLAAAGTGIHTGGGKDRKNVDINIIEDGSGLNETTVSTEDFEVGPNDKHPSNLTIKTGGINLTMANNFSTDATPSLDLVNDGIEDNAGNTLSAGASDPDFSSITDGLVPLVSNITVQDVGNTTGDIDTAKVVFSEPIKDSSITASNWDMSGTPFDTKITGTTDDNTMKFRLDNANEKDGTDVQDVEYNPGATRDLVGSLLEEVSSGDVSEKDGAKPRIIDFEYQDSDNNGKIDQFKISFTEALSSSNIGQNDLNISQEGNFTNASFGTQNDGNGATGTSTTVTLGTESESVRTVNVSTLEIETISGNNFELKDSAGNIYNTSEKQTLATYTDGAQPVLMNAQIDNKDSTDSTTKVNLEFSEDISTADKVTLNNSKEINSLGSGPWKIEGTYSDGVIQTGNYTAINGFGTVKDTNNNPAKLFKDNKVVINSFRKDLKKDWNYISFPIADSTTPKVENVLETNKIDSIWTYTKNGWENYVPDKSDSNNDFTTVSAGQGYIVNAKEKHTINPNVNNQLSNQGVKESSPGEFSLQEGWNLIGQYQEFRQDADNTSTGAFKVLGSSDHYNKVYRQTSKGTLGGLTDVSGNTGDMITGEAYWLQTVGDLSNGTLAYTEN